MCYTLLSLFDHSGNWSQPYRDAGWNVIQIDRKILDDDGVFLVNKDLQDINAHWFYENIFDNFGTVDGIIMAPPCTDAAFWALENPVGRLNKLCPELSDWGPRYFQPYEYGDPYTKKTGLWGKFNMPTPTNIVVPVDGSKMLKYGGKSERTKELRSVTPMGFARAFFEANKEVVYSDEEDEYDWD